MLAFFRFLAAVFLLIAVIAAVHDGTRSLAANQLVMSSLIEHWSALAPKLLESAQAAVKRSTHPLVWDAGFAKLLQLPSALLLCVVGMAFAYAGRRRRRVNVFAN
jgi:hypothetical protein